MNAKRRRLVTGTEHVWGIWVHTLGFAVGVPLCFALAAVIDRLRAADIVAAAEPVVETNFSNFITNYAAVLISVAAIISALLLRYHIWPPVAKLYRNAPSPDAFWKHFRAVGQRCWPFGLLMAVMIAQLVLPLPEVLVIGQVGAIFLVRHFIETRRDRFIAHDVVDYLPG